MASLKEVKTRITSVQSTRKITSAMKMVASSKLHKAQQAIENMRPYETQLAHIMSAFVNGAQGDVSSPFSAQRSVQNVVLIAVSSNGSLCGVFNANLIKKVRETIKEYQAQHVDIRVIPFGRKVADALSKEGFSFDSDHSSMLEHPSYEDAAVIVRNLMKEFVEGTVDRVELIYHHFKSTSTQTLEREALLPVEHTTPNEDASTGNDLDYIIEPSVEEIMAELVPQTLCLKLYTALLDSVASEHAARVVAMQVATDNADELLRDLTLTYNKTRQQAITTELLDIVGGSMQ